jgi:hypothetical protein
MKNEVMHRRIQEWITARVARLAVYRQMARFRCTAQEPYEWETGSEGRGPCYRMWSHVTEDWCDSCRQREPHFQEMKPLRRVERDAFRRLCALVNRSASAKSVDAVDPHDGGTPA